MTTMKITRNATAAQSKAIMAPASNGKGKTVKAPANVSSVQLHAANPAPDGNLELAAPAKGKGKAVKAAPAVTAPAPDALASLEIRINALASMIRGLNDTCVKLVDENANLRLDIAALTVLVETAPVVATAAPAPASVADNKVFMALAPADNPFETAATAAIANFHAGYVNEKVLDAATRMGKGVTARCYLRTNENRAFKTYLKACGLSLAEADATLDAMVFDA